MADAEILAAGGIVVRSGPQPQIAIVQLRKCGSWVLPKGKLDDGESFEAAAKREVLEETGHHVALREFLGTLSYEVGSRQKIVQFWSMQPIGGRPRELMRDVRAVEWLPVDDAVARLTHARERHFLAQVGPLALARKTNPRRLRMVSVEETGQSGRLQNAKPGQPSIDDLQAIEAAAPANRQAPSLVSDVAAMPVVPKSATPVPARKLLSKARNWLHRRFAARR